MQIPRMRIRTLVAGAAAVGALLAAAGCSGGGDDVPAAAAESQATGVRLVSPAEAAAVAGAGATVLDIRTPEEYAGGHLAGAVNVDFYATDFADRIGALDRDASYVLYCRSGNRSAAAAELMRTLGFADVAEVDGGIVAWSAAGLPVGA